MWIDQVQQELLADPKKRPAAATFCLSADVIVARGQVRHPTVQHSTGDDVNSCQVQTQWLRDWKSSHISCTSAVPAHMCLQKDIFIENK